VSDTRHKLTRQDVAEIALGACVMAIPLGITEEAWDLGVKAREETGS